MDLLRSLTKDFIGLLYPELCRACEKPLLTGENLVCTECLLTFPTTISKDDRAALLTKFKGILPLERVYTLLKYQKSGIVKNLMYSIKYRGDQDLGIFLGRVLGKVIIQDGSTSLPDIIVPIPLHPRKMKKRGFNQSLLLAQGISSILGVGYSDSMVRLLDNPTQTRKSKIERIENTRDLFALSPGSDIEDGSHVMIVDDTLTTGATVHAAGEILTKELNCRVSVAVLALAK